MRLFLYGTLLDPVTLARRSGDPAAPARCFAATLHGWRRVASPGGRFPTLRRQRRGAVDGVVVDVDAAAMRRLSAYEGDAYRLLSVVVETTTGKSAAKVWIAPGGTRRPWKE
ncbi:MAG TPA: gamma-glutamylcyclotransferase family protein [Acetobacteraceae bacterium]|nr:gamma-glutamylcyclotransferase family protein [Acetobacteraceae bacterium]